MTDEQFAVGVDAILARHSRGHSAHRALDLLWTRYTQELPEGHPVRAATAKWMAAIEGDHAATNPYPLPRTPWLQRPLRCKFGRHYWINNASEHDWGSVLDCPDCGAHQGYGNPCP